MLTSRHAHAFQAVMVSLTLFLPAIALAGADLLGISGASVLYDINTGNGAATNPRTVGNKVTMISFAPSGVLYGVSQGTPSDFPPGGNLFTILPTTGAATFVAALDQYIFTEGDIAFDPTSGILYAVDGPGTLYKIHTTSGVVTLVGFVGTNLDLSAMAFDAAGSLFTVDSFGPTLLEVNKANAAVISTKPLGPVNQEVGGLAFNPSTGTLFHTSGTGAPKLDTINTVTGVATAIGPVPVTGGVWGLTFPPLETTSVQTGTWGQVKVRHK